MYRVVLLLYQEIQVYSRTILPAHCFAEEIESNHSLRCVRQPRTLHCDPPSLLLTHKRNDGA